MSNISINFVQPNGTKINISFSSEATIKEMIEKYFEYLEVPSERRKGDRIIFIYNGSKIPNNSQETLNKYFHTFNTKIINIVVIETDNIIGY